VQRLARLTGRIVEEARKLDRRIEVYEDPLQARPYVQLRGTSGEVREYSHVPGLKAQVGLPPARRRRIELEAKVKQALAILEDIPTGE